MDEENPLDANILKDELDNNRLKLSDQDSDQKRIFKSPSGASSNLPSIFSRQRNSSTQLKNFSSRTHSKINL